LPAFKYTLKHQIEDQTVSAAYSMQPCCRHLWLICAVQVSQLPGGQKAARMVQHCVYAAVTDGLGTDVLRVISGWQTELLSNILQATMTTDQLSAELCKSAARTLPTQYLMQQSKTLMA
jgi:hypothetical protein